MALTAKQQLFVAEYLKDLNATQAATRAGYSAATAEQQGYQLLQIPSVVSGIAELAAQRDQRIQIDSDFVLRTLHALADFDMETVFNADGSLKNISDMPVVARKAISGFEVEEIYAKEDEPEIEMEGQAHGGALKRKRRTVVSGRLVKVKMWSKDKAIELLARHKSLLNDKVQHEHTGKDGEPLMLDDTSLVARMDALYAAAARRKLEADLADLV